ncbi:serine hydrolase [Congregibacter brevis]|uniref:Serine hydrolase n=1 Tax=Congregibacter brevis TaxID=3081201 RepID=A0ABZ0IAP3_9GAMM|nr:serine hydrolase [Congregibacter sp. IMCC45268]
MLKVRLTGVMLLTLSATLVSSISVTTHAAEEGYDYFSANRQLIRNGVQSLLTCNGLFTSRRTLEQVFDQELAYLGDRTLGDANGGPYTVHPREQAVSVGGGENGPAILSAFRKGIGCVVMAPDMSLEDISSLPKLEMPYSKTDPRSLDWPNGDANATQPVPTTLNAEALTQASDWAFNRESEEQDTLSLLVIHEGKIIHERYADGVDQTTRTRTWSTAKSIAATLIGMRVDSGKMALDAPLKMDWSPTLPGGEDPRNAITLRHLLNMSSGLYPIDSFNMEYATGSGLSYWAGASSVDGARNRGLVRKPGTSWDYENYDTLLAVKAFKDTLASATAYLEFPRKRLLDRIGMHNTLLSTDRFGDFILSSQVYTNARDLGRFGLLYLNNGVWDGERLISEKWIEFSRTPAPASAPRGNDYGAQWWLVPDKRKNEVPADAYSTAGNRGQYVIIDPSHDLIIVRRGLDYGKQGFNRWDLLREVLKAFPD